MTNPAAGIRIRKRTERERLNAALHAADAETGFWDDNGRAGVAAFGRGSLAVDTNLRSCMRFAYNGEHGVEA